MRFGLLGGAARYISGLPYFSGTFGGCRLMVLCQCVPLDACAIGPPVRPEAPGKRSSWDRARMAAKKRA